MFVLEGLAALAAKVAAASTVSQAVAGLGIAVVGVTGAGAAGVLPTPVQNVVAGAVEVVSPFDLPDSADAIDDDGTPDQGPSDAPSSDDSPESTTDDDGTPDQGPGDAPGTDDSGTDD